jgi:hypothetical protein
MALTFPIDLLPNAINDRTAPEHSVAQFKSDTGLATSICFGCGGHSASFSLSFSSMDPIEEAKLLKFWGEIGGSSSVSCRSFTICDTWRGWDLIKSWPIWREQLLRDPLGRAWWKVTNRLVYNGELCFLQGATLTIENIARRA